MWKMCALWISEDQPLQENGAALQHLDCADFSSNIYRPVMPKKFCVLVPRVNSVTLDDRNLSALTSEKQVFSYSLFFVKKFKLAQNYTVKKIQINYADYLTQLVSSFCSKLSLLSFHKFPAIMPKNSRSPRFRLEINFCQQSSGLLISNV